jgi:ferredoxin/flavodoxin---NADP+ reductase
MSFEKELELFPSRINYVKEISPGVYILSFPREDSFVPGQVLGLSCDMKNPPRLYSIASGNREDEVRILFNIVPEGSLTKRMAALKAGDSIFTSKAFGSFYGKANPAYWISSGTGLAPFLSMLHSGLGKNKTLIHGGRTLQSFYFQDELLKEMDGRYIRCCSREKGKGVYEGRLTEYLRKQENLPLDFDYYLCGSSEMVSETRDILIEKGIPFNQIIAEIYF